MTLDKTDKTNNKPKKSRVWRVTVVVVGVFLAFSSLLSALENLLIGDLVMAVILLAWTFLVGVLTYNFATEKRAFSNILNKEIGISKKNTKKENKTEEGVEYQKDEAKEDISKFCKECGEPVDPEAKYCAKCGFQLRN